MRNIICKKNQIKKNLNLTIFLITSFFLTSCQSTDLRIAKYKFIYEGQNFVIISLYSPDNPESSNKLIGDNFIAVDMDQNRIMDNIARGEITLSKAQEIYDYSLGLLEKEYKLNEVDLRNGSFEVNELHYNFNIKTFYLQEGKSFNEFTIVDKREGLNNYNSIVLIDHGANGVLDEILVGEIQLVDANVKYQKIINLGLTQKKIKKNDGFIVVK